MKQMYSNDKILVSVFCEVYNHEAYLRQCLEGLTMQQCNFKYEILIHDDCSQDNSVDIIKAYEDAYPDIIKPIYQPENQTSKGIDLWSAYQFPRAKGKYIAVCEGDDYWTDPLKLQKQVDYMESNIGCSLCFHRTNTLIHQTGELKDEFIVRDMPGKSSIEDLAKENYIHTPSVLFRVYPSVLQQYCRVMPCNPSDYIMWMLLAEKGDIYKIEEAMAVYRYGSGIWSNNWNNEKLLANIMVLCRLSVILTDPSIKKILLSRINLAMTNFLDEYNMTQQQLLQICSSRAYRIGRLILKPFKYIKSILKK